MYRQQKSKPRRVARPMAKSLEEFPSIRFPSKTGYMNKTQAIRWEFKAEGLGF